KGTWKGQPVAIKRLLTVHQREKEDLMKILKEEANVLERAKNRHIIQFYCIDEYEGSPVMITDFADMGNLLKVLENNKIKLCDFGLARIKENISSKSMFSTSYFAGTTPWMAPELFGLKPIFGRKSDIYAYG